MPLAARARWGGWGEYEVWGQWENNAVGPVVTAGNSGSMVANAPGVAGATAALRRDVFQVSPVPLAAEDVGRFARVPLAGGHVD
jgi:hypothetical protein